MDDASFLFPIFGRFPDDLKDIVCDQVEEFVHQASFLRRADLYQAYLLHRTGIRLETAEDTVDVKQVDADEHVLDAAVEDELGVVQSLTTKLPPVLEQDIASSFDNENACNPQAVHRWFEVRNKAVSKACSRVRKKYGSIASVSKRGNAVIRSVASQPDDGIHDAASALAACLSPMSALETSMKVMSLLQSDDPRNPSLKDNCASRAFALVSRCPSIMLQCMFLRAVINTRGVQLTALDRTESYTIIAQWLQDAVHLHNDPHVQLCLGALRKIPFTEVHIVCFARHHMISGTESISDAPTAANNPTILDFVRRLTEAERSATVRQAAQELLDKWARIDMESDHVILSGAKPSQAVVPAKKGAKGASAEPLRPHVFPNDRRMKAPQPIALHRDGRGSVELAKSNTSNMSKAAAQRRVHESSGPLSVSDIKKRKEQQQLMQKLGKKQKSLPCTASGGVPVSAASAVATASGHAPSTAMLQTSRGAARGSVFSDALAPPVGATGNEVRRISSNPGADQRMSPAADALLRRASSATGASPVAASEALRSPLHSEGWRLSGPATPASPGVPFGSLADAAMGSGASMDMGESSRGLSSLLQITQDAAAQEVRKRREALPVLWQVGEASLDEAKRRLAAAKAGGSRWHPEVRAALHAAVAQGEAASQARWALLASGNEGLLDSAALENLSDIDELWSTPEALTALPDTLMQICASWSADSTEKAVQREREYLATAAPAASHPAAVQEPDDVPDPTATAAAAETATRVPFWLQPPEDAGAEEWKHFEGRTHVVGAAQAWQAGLRFLLGESGIPASGISSADLHAARKCDGTEPEEPDHQTAAAAAAVVAAAGPPAAVFSIQGPAAPAPHQQPYSPAMAGPPPQQEYRMYQEYQPAATPMPMQAQGAPQPQMYPGGGAGGYGVMHAVQYEWPGQTMQPLGQVMPGAQYMQQAGLGQQPHQVVYAQPGAQVVGGAPVYASQYMQQGQPMAYGGPQYPGGQPVMYHYAQQAGPAAGNGEQPGRMY